MTGGHCSAPLGLVAEALAMGNLTTAVVVVEEVAVAVLILCEHHHDEDETEHPKNVEAYWAFEGHGPHSKEQGQPVLGQVA